MSWEVKHSNGKITMSMNNDYPGIERYQDSTKTLYRAIGSFYWMDTLDDAMEEKKRNKSLDSEDELC